MITKEYHFCPRCGGAFEIQSQDGQDIQICSVCNHVLYKNQNVCVEGIIVRDHSLLVVRRGREPKKGYLDIPGGFVNANENPQAAVIRELSEELHVKATVIKLLGVYGPSEYLFDGVLQFNASIIYSIDISDQTPIASDDVASIEWHNIDRLPSIEKFAFSAQKEFFNDILAGTITLE